MTEGRFVSEFLGTLRKRYPGLVAHQHFTMPRSPGNTVRFQPKNPYDFYVLWRGKVACVEAKQVKGRSFPLAKYRAHQTEELKRVRATGNTALYLVNVRELKKEKAPADIRRYAYRGLVNCCLFIDPWSMGSLVERVDREGRKSIPVDSLVDVTAFFLGRVDGAWDVREFMSCVFDPVCVCVYV